MAHFSKEENIYIIYVIMERGVKMGVNMQEFLEKIGVTLPEPRVMEGFGMELPGVYLSRCMDVLIPAIEERLANQKEIVLQDFLAYVKQYNQAPVAIPAATAKVVVAKKVAAKPAGSVVEKIEAKSTALVWDKMSMQEKGAAIRNWFKKNPTGSRVKCAKALNIAESTVYRCLALSSEDYDGDKYKSTRKKKAKTKDVKAVEKMEPKKEEPKPAIEKAKPASSNVQYKEGGYMASLRARFENRDNPHNVVPEPAKEAPKNNEVVLDLKVPFLQNYFNGLSKEKQLAAIECKWDSMEVPSVYVQHLNNRLLEQGASLKNERLTTLEYNALTSLLNNSFLSQDELVAYCNGYLVRT